ncbi:hypothetical protein HHK36_019233 [Tetracentron sinense]|uniref:4-coumarate--CoA ligase n=1 Tax=Tetracentron sinense TaxID=13715 RepID=A0A834YX08_TETSI|nr:hypothetical protein HHK36_019233 [Tetracentron sinense]
MSIEEGWSNAIEEQSGGSGQALTKTPSFCARTGVYHSLHQLGGDVEFPTRPDLDTATFVLSQFPHPDQAESRVALIDSATNCRVTYADLKRSVNSLAACLYHGLGVRKGDVVFLLSPNSLLYPTICLAVFSVGAVLTPANPLNTASEIAKQVRDSGAKLAISAPEELHKLVPTGVPTLVTTRLSNDNSLSIEELIEGGDPLEVPQARPTQSDIAAVLYSSGTTGASKGVVLTHANFISIMTLLKWTVNVWSSQDDVFLCFIPMFHIYGLAFFALGLFCVGTTTVLLPKFDIQAMLDAIQMHNISNIPAVPPVILGLVKNTSKSTGHDLSSLRRISSGAAPLSKEIAEAFRERFPWVELRQGYGLTETCGAATIFDSNAQAKARPDSSGMLSPSFCAKVVDIETGLSLPPYRKGELWLKSPTVMKGYLGNDEATAATIDQEGWLRTGDLCYFDEEGFLYIVDRIKELIKHNGYQVAPAELESVLLSHPHILDAAVIPVEDEESGQIPMAYVVRATDSGLTEDDVIKFVAGQVAPYKKVRKVGFISVIPKSAAGKILRKQLVAQSQQHFLSKL